MTVVLSVHDATRCIGTCDARCYNAKTTTAKTVECLCICGGRNHGVGLDRATENVRRDKVGLKPGAVERFASAHALVAEELLVLDRTRIVGDHRRARLIASEALWMRKHQMELPFDEQDCSQPAVGA